MSEPSPSSPWRRAAFVIVTGLALQFLPLYLAPSLAVQRAWIVDQEVYRRLATRGSDPWGNSWRRGPPPGESGPDYIVYGYPYSCGPNGLAEEGKGDDLYVDDEFSSPWTAVLVGVWFLPFALYLLAWGLVLRLARRAEDRALGWRELGWAGLTGGPAAAFALGYAWWGSDNAAWQDLLATQQGGSLLGWRASLVGGVVGALFVAGWALSRPPRRAAAWAEDSSALPPLPSDAADE
jgi:hypothetical protein